MKLRDRILLLYNYNISGPLIYSDFVLTSKTMTLSGIIAWMRNSNQLSQFSTSPRPHTP